VEVWGGRDGLLARAAGSHPVVHRLGSAEGWP